MSIAFVVQRYGAEVAGGAEALCRDTARALVRAGEDVTVFTTTARDYLTWAPFYPVGSSVDDGVTVRRFAVGPPDPGRAADLVRHLGLSPGDPVLEAEWAAAQGPVSRGMLAALRDIGDGPSAGTDPPRAVALWTYLYATSQMAMPLVRDRAILVPLAHEEPMLRFALTRGVIRSARAHAFMVPEEQSLVRQMVGTGDIPGVVVGAGLDPPADGAPATPVLDALLRTWDFEMGKDVVVDASGMGQILGTDASVPLVATYPNHPITDKFDRLTAFPLARSVTPILPASNGRAAIGFLQTSQRSWAEADQAQIKAGAVELNPDKGDKAGPVTIGAVTATNAINVPGKDPKAVLDSHDTRPPESRFAVIGDSDFAANYALGIQGNSDLFMNVVNYLAQQENLIAIRPKPPADSRLTITAQQMRAISIMSLLVLPALVFGSGVYTWWRRR